jgi:hypothetical protein
MPLSVQVLPWLPSHFGFDLPPDIDLLFLGDSEELGVGRRTGSGVGVATRTHTTATDTSVGTRIRIRPDAPASR